MIISGGYFACVDGIFILITCRNVQVESVETLDQAVTPTKERGFINYYGNWTFGIAMGMPFR